MPSYALEDVSGVGTPNLISPVVAVPPTSSPGIVNTSSSDHPVPILWMVIALRVPLLYPYLQTLNLSSDLPPDAGTVYFQYG